MKVVNEKCWIANDGKTLVPDGHEESAVLFGIRGDHIKDERAKLFKNADKFLVELDEFKPTPPKPVQTAPVMGTVTIVRADGQVDGALSEEDKAAAKKIHEESAEPKAEKTEVTKAKPAKAAKAPKAAKGVTTVKKAGEHK